MIEPRQLCQLEIPIYDVDLSLKFYEHVFGWKRSPAELHDYIVMQVPDDHVFGVALIPQLKKADATMRSGPVLYFNVEDAGTIMDRAVACGGTKLFGPQKAPGYGVIYQFEDPNGVRFGLYQTT